MLENERDITIADEPLRRGRVALCLAHPGHELFTFGWIKRLRPRVLILTDGSGRLDPARSETTRALLEGIGATPDSLFCRESDAAVYERVLARDWNHFVELGREIAEVLVRHAIRFVIVDAYERRILTHDLWHLICTSAVTRARRSSGRRIDVYEYAMMGQHGAPAHHPGVAETILLDDETLREKHAAANSFARSEFAHEIAGFKERMGAEGARSERLVPVTPIDVHREFSEPPVYETVAERLVERGVYEHAIGFKEHLVPIAEALRGALGNPNTRARDLTRSFIHSSPR